MRRKEINTPKSELRHRIDALKRCMAAHNIDATLIVQNTDLFYFAGTIQQGQLYVPVDDVPILMVHKSYARAKAESAIDRIVRLKSPRQIPTLLKDHGYARPRSLGLELDVLPANLYLSYQKLFGKTQLMDISHAVRTIRSVKSDYELAILRQAAKLSDKVAAGVKEFLAEGRTELEVAGQVEARARKLGHQGIVRMRLFGAELFYGHLLTGPSATVPSYLASPTGGHGASRAVAQGAGFRVIKRNEPVLFDYVFAYKGYIADSTRIFSLGDPPDELLQAHEDMLALQQAICETACPDAVSGDLYETAIQYAADRGYANHFMGADDDRVRFIGHGVGLELDEYPFLAKRQQMQLAKGMTVALEPKLIFPGLGVVGIENTHVVTDTGLEALTRFDNRVQIVD